jgi:Flp pilus assembly pilin Flp
MAWLKNQKGQTAVEYILLLAVSTSLVMTLYRSQLFQKFFGPNGQLGQKIKVQTEFGYRHAYYDPNITNEPALYEQAADHPSYYDSSLGEGRFFGPKDLYP